MKVFLSKLLISAAVGFHCYLLLFNEIQSRRLERNSTNNMSMRYGPYLPAYAKEIIQEYIQEFIIAMLLCCIPMLLSKRK